MEEAFLINPRKRRRRVRSGKRKRRGKRKGGLPSALLRRMMKAHGPRKGMREAWKAFRGGKRKNFWPDDSSGHRTAARKGWRKRKVRKARGRRRNYYNPFGEEVMIVGSNRRRRRRTRRRKRSVLGLFNAPRRRRRSRRRRNVYGNRRRRRYYRLNARRRYRRRYRRNPAVAGQVFSLRKPMGFIMPALFGFGGFYAADRVPLMVGITGNIPRLGVKAAVGFAGSMLLRRFIGPQNATFFAIGVAINLMRDALNTFVFRTAMLGYGAFPYQEVAYSGIGAYPEDVSSPYSD